MIKKQPFMFGLRSFYFAMLILPYFALAQGSLTTDTAVQIIFRDTIHDFVFDSLTHDLGEVHGTTNARLVKHFKYIGTDSIYIRRAFSGDPHFICKYPGREILIPHNIYPFTICFWHKGRVGRMHKVMGFNLSDENIIYFRFKGHYKSDLSIKVDSIIRDQIGYIPDSTISSPNQKPLIWLDGKAVALDKLNQYSLNAIVRIQVYLKEDEKAIALWGSRAVNGVVVLETRYFRQ